MFDNDMFDNNMFSFLHIYSPVRPPPARYFLQDATGPLVFVYFALLVFFGAFILLNLTLAVIMSKFREALDEMDEKKMRIAEWQLRKGGRQMRSATAVKSLIAAKAAANRKGDSELANTLSVAIKNRSSSRSLGRRNSMGVGRRNAMTRFKSAARMVSIANQMGGGKGGSYLGGFAGGSQTGSGLSPIPGSPSGGVRVRGGKAGGFAQRAKSTDASNKRMGRKNLLAGLKTLTIDTKGESPTALAFSSTKGGHRIRSQPKGDSSKRGRSETVTSAMFKSVAVTPTLSKKLGHKLSHKLSKKEQLQAAKVEASEAKVVAFGRTTSTGSKRTGGTDSHHQIQQVQQAIATPSKRSRAVMKTEQSWRRAQHGTLVRSDSWLKDHGQFEGAAGRCSRSWRRDARQKCYDYVSRGTFQKERLDEGVPLGPCAPRGKCGNCMRNLVFHARFSQIIMACIALNALALALDHHGISRSFWWVLFWVNFAFTIIFFLELFLKLIALGPLGYVRDRFNLLDMFIVVVSMVELVSDMIDFVGQGSVGGSTGLQAFRLLRLFRVLRLVKLVSENGTKERRMSYGESV